jgi:hypothetical protein
VRPRRSALTLAQQGLLLFIVGTVPILFAAVQPWVWAVYTLAAFAAFVCRGLSLPAARPLVPIRFATAPIALFMGISLFLCLPLPLSIVKVLSPVRGELIMEARTLAGGASGWAALSYAPLQSLSWWAFWLGLCLFFITVRGQLRLRSFLTATLWVLFALAAMEALYGLLQALVPNMGVLGVTKYGLGNARGTWINRNHFAGFMEMALPVLLGFALSRLNWEGRLRLRTLFHADRPDQHGLLLLGLVLMALALLFSKSRAGITGAMIGFGVFLMMIRGRGRRLPAGGRILIGLFLLLTVAYGARIGMDPIIDRFLMIGQTGIDRADFWRDSLAILKDHPAGIGPAAFKVVFPVYNVSLLSEDITLYYLHSDLLQLLLETGWAGWLLLMAPFGVFMLRSPGRIRRIDLKEDSLRFFTAAGAYSGLIALCFHSLFDFNLQIPANAFLFVLLMAVVGACTEKQVND